MTTRNSALALSVSMLALAASSLGLAQDSASREFTSIKHKSIPPCGTITKSTKLLGNCRAPLQIGADSIRVDLNGYSILEQPGQPGVEVLDHRRVTITNGTIRGTTVGLLVRNGGNHTFSNLEIFSGGEQTPNVSIENVDRTVVNRVVCLEPRFDVTAFRFSGNLSRISRVSCSGLNSGAQVSGDRLIISDNIFRVLGGDESLQALNYTGDKSTIRRNLLVGDSSRVTQPVLLVSGNSNIVKDNSVVGNAAGIGLDSDSVENVFRRNMVSVDDSNPSSVAINGGDSACSNTWKNNDFSTDSEGDGPSDGCIQ